MRTLQPVIWAKGTFLSPQHLQAQDRFIESVLQFRLDALSFRPWGFSQLQFNQEQLANGVFAIHRAQGMFPDGLPFEIPDSDPVPPARPIAGRAQRVRQSGPARGPRCDPPGRAPFAGGCRIPEWAVRRWPPFR